MLYVADLVASGWSLRLWNAKSEHHITACFDHPVPHGTYEVIFSLGLGQGSQSQSQMAMFASLEEMHHLLMHINFFYKLQNVF